MSTRQKKDALAWADEHPVKDLIAAMLERRGDNPGVALGRGLAICEALILGGYIEKRHNQKRRKAQAFKNGTTPRQWYGK